MMLLNFLAVSYLILLTNSLVASKKQCYYKCGTAIITEDGKEKFPWEFLIKAKRISLSDAIECVGILVSDQHLMTAAHCLYDRGMQIPAGLIHVYHEKIPHPLEIQFFTIAPTYKDSNLEKNGHDMALIRLQEPIKLDGEISPICVSPIDLDESISNLAISKGSTLLPVHQITTRECRNVLTKLYGGFWGLIGIKKQLAEGDICVGNRGWAPTDCVLGGSPMVWKNKYEQWFLIGVTSRGQIKCGEVDQHPGILTSVANYMTLSESYLAGEISCIRNYNGFIIEDFYK